MIGWMPTSSTRWPTIKEVVASILEITGLEERLRGTRREEVAVVEACTSSTRCTRMPRRSMEEAIWGTKGLSKGGSDMEHPTRCRSSFQLSMEAVQGCSLRMMPVIRSLMGLATVEGRERVGLKVATDSRITAGGLQVAANAKPSNR